MQRRFLALAALPIVAGALTILLLENQLLMLYDDEYVVAIPALRITLLGSSLSALVYMGNSVSQFLPGLRATALLSYLVAIGGWTAFALFGGKNLASIALTQVTLVLACQALAIVIGARGMRRWSAS